MCHVYFSAVYKNPQILFSLIVIIINTYNNIIGTQRREQGKWIMDKLYVKPYVRITPYLVGIFLGYLINKRVTLGDGVRGKLGAFGCWGTAVALGVIVVYGPWRVYKRNGTPFDDIENIMYSSCHRFVWSCAVAMVIFTCHNKYGGYVNTFLSWRAWLPLSRLTYGGYLLHMMVMYYLMTVREVPFHYQDSVAIQGFLSILLLTYGFAFVLAVCVEYPVSNLEKLIFRV